MGISTIRAQNPQGVVTAGYDLQSKADQLDKQIGEQVRALNRLREDWKGEAANAAFSRAYRSMQAQHLEHEKMAALAVALKDGGQDLVTARETLMIWVDVAESMFDVSDEGVVTVRPPNDTAPWVAIAAQYTKIIVALITAFEDVDATVAGGIELLNQGFLPGNDTPGGIDPDRLNSDSMKWLQSLAGSGNSDSTEHGLPNTDLSIMGMTPDGRLFTIQGDTAINSPPGGGPGPRSAEGGFNNITYWKMDEHGKWVIDEVVKDPFPNLSRPDGTHDASTIPTSTFNVGDTMYTSVMNVDNWRDGTWQTRSSMLYRSDDFGRTWTPVNSPNFKNNEPGHNQPFQVQSFAPSADGKYVYMYGTEDGRANDGMHVARVPVGDIENASKYEYWNGTSFDAHQSPDTSPPVVHTPPGYSGVGEPNVHFYENKALLTFNDNKGNLFTSSSVDGINWSTPQLVAALPGAYGVFQSPLSGGDSVDASISLWAPYGTELVQIENSDTRGLGSY